MKLEDKIRESIHTYPGLYKDVNYELSRLKVLDQLFLVIGNGYEWANTKNPEQGGYLVESNNKKYDLPYGKKTFKKLPKDYFQRRLYNLPFITDEYKVNLINTGKKYKNYIIEIIPPTEENSDYFSKLDDKSYFLMEEKSTYKFTPYPVCEYSVIVELYDGDLFIQPDWLRGAIDVAKESLVYFSDEQRYKEDTYYPSEKNIKYDLRIFQEKESPQKVSELRKLWGYSVSDLVPTHEEIHKRKNESWQKYKKESIEFFEKFLIKYNKSKT